MNRFLPVVLFCFVAVLCAQDRNDFKNSLGWESGLSYRRHINKTIWLGINLAGSYENSLTKGSQVNSTDTLADGATSTTSIDDKDTNINYSGTIKIEFGKEVFEYKKLDIDLIVAGGCKLAKSKYFNGGTFQNSGDQPSQSVLGILALEPKLFVWDRISIGTQFGIQYTYTYAKNNYTDRYSNSTYVESGTDNSSMVTHYFQLFGNVSLSSNLIIHYYF